MNVDRFVAALPPGTDPWSAEAVGNDLLARYAEPHRHYHTARHLDAVLSIIGANARQADDPGAVQLAAWFHDAVYDPSAGSGENEEASAALAGTALSALGVGRDLASEVTRLVRLTAGHDPDRADRNGCLLADADLAVLAAERPVYDRYAVAVRREYAHVPDELYRVGRSTVLNTLLDMADLYRVVPARTEWTATAHENMRRELAALAAQ